jgi:spermidine/putrescine transport system permease protein
VLILFPFNRDGVGGFPPKHLTLAWYRLLFNDSAILDSVLNSLLVAAGAVILSLTLGLLAALALDRATFPGKSIFRRLVLLPLILPGIITGLSLLTLFVGIHMNLSLVTITLGHGTALISVATTEIFAGLQKLDRRQEEASLDLGANHWKTFWRVTLPSLDILSLLCRVITPEINAISTLILLFSIGTIMIWYRLRTRGTRVDEAAAAVLPSTLKGEAL